MNTGGGSGTGSPEHLCKPRWVANTARDERTRSAAMRSSAKRAIWRIPGDMRGGATREPIRAYDFGWVRNHSAVAGIASLSGVA